jgi:hypothetical protein
VWLAEKLDWKGLMLTEKEKRKIKWQKHTKLRTKLQRL